MLIMFQEKIENQIRDIKSKEELGKIVEILRVDASNEKSERMLKYIEETLKVSKTLDDKISIVNLQELQIKQFFGSRDKIPETGNILQSMKKVSKEINYEDGLILCYSIEWGLEKFKGNIQQSKRAIEKAMELIEIAENLDDYVYYLCYYSYAIEIWLDKHDPRSGEILEECVPYFLNKGLHKGLVHALGYLSIIYLQIQRRKKATAIIKKILSSKVNLDELPKELQIVTYYFMGVALKLDFFFSESEKYFLKAKELLKMENQDSIYAVYDFTSSSHLLTIKALLGELMPTLHQIEKIESKINSKEIAQMLDNSSKNQIKHTFNLTKFYILSRSNDTNPEKLNRLEKSIYKDCKLFYSDFFMLSEYILHSNLSTKELKELLKKDNYCINSVKHILNYKLNLQKKSLFDASNEKYFECINILKNRIKIEKNNFLENVYSNLLISQHLFSLRRYTEIYSLLKKYKRNLDRIEILEMRIFMEAFIQVGAYKNGDPLGPALQYMAIKKCRQYGFSRLENKLLDYLDIQGNDTLRMMA